MAKWGTSRTDDLQARIDDIQQGLAALSQHVGKDAKRAGRQVAETARDVESRAADSAGDLLSTLSPALGDLSRQIESLLSLAGAFTGRFARKAGQESRQAYTAVEERVENHAMLAVLAAAGVGFLLGAVVTGAAAAARSGSDTKAPDRQG